MIKKAKKQGAYREKRKALEIEIRKKAWDRVLKKDFPKKEEIGEAHG